MSTSQPTTTEVVSLFSTREQFEAAVRDLLQTGFERTDLSVLASHESIDVAGKPGEPLKDAVTAMVGELKYEVPLVASGAVVLAGGAIAATIAGLIGAAVGGLAAKEVLDEVTAKPHTEDFARALNAGSVILWVRCDKENCEMQAQDVMNRNGGSNTHRHQST